MRRKAVDGTQRLVAEVQRSVQWPAGAAAASTWALSDGRAGNVRQAEALARALRYGEIQHCTLTPRWPWRSLAPRWFPGCDHAFGPAFASALGTPPPLAIGCGRQAALATRLLHARGAHAVQILDPRVDLRHWDLVIAPRHDHLRGDNVLATLGSLHPVDDDWLAHGRDAFPQLASLPQPRTAVLLGAASRHAPMATSTLLRAIRQLQDISATEGGSLLLTASRRTPAALRNTLRERFAATRGMAWLGPEDGGNPYPGLLGWADRIVCTPDSVNMVSEASATTVPVHVIDPPCAHGRLHEFLDALLDVGRIRAFDGTLAAFPVVPLRETARVAADVRRRLDL